MTHASLKERLARYMMKSHGWVAKGALCDLARQAVGATGEHTGRRLRELENEGVLEVQYRKGHAFYRHKREESTEEKVSRGLAWFDGLPA